VRAAEYRSESGFSQDGLVVREKGVIVSDVTNRRGETAYSYQKEKEERS
jgi:hypothetical protein